MNINKNGTLSKYEMACLVNQMINAELKGDEETAVHISNVLPDNIDIEELLAYYVHEQEEMYWNWVDSQTPYFAFD